MSLDDVSEPITGNGANTERGHDDGEVLAGLHELAQDLGVLAERPVAFQSRPQGKGRGEVAQEEVGQGQRQDERVPRVCPQFLGRDHRDQQDRVQGRAQDHHGEVDAQEKPVDVVGHFRVPKNVSDCLQKGDLTCLLFR